MLKGNYGIEKEALRVLENGEIVSTKHPLGANFIDKFNNPHITVDFSEQQSEVITGIHDSVEGAYKEIVLLSNILYRNMAKGEYLWNYSLPYGSIKNASIALGECEQVDYRKNLLKESPISMQLISGIHFNFSFDEERVKNLTDDENNELYFKLAQRYIHHAHVMEQVFGMSPTKDFETFDRISYRTSNDEGYNNGDGHKNSMCKFETYQEYEDHVQNRIESGEIKSHRNIYSIVRTKPFAAKRIEWIEFRNIDLDYTKPYGIDIKKFKLLNQFIHYLAFGIEEDVHEHCEYNINKKEFDLTIKELKEMKKWLVSNNLDISLVDSYITKFSNNEFDAQAELSVSKMIEMQKNIALENKSIPLKPIENMELSTQILVERAYEKGYSVKILDEEKNLIKINKTTLEMATLNPFDSKKGLDIIDSKIKTNEYLREINLSSTNQKIFTSIEEASKLFDKFENKKIVVKPVSTNFSNGLTVFEKQFTKDDYLKAIEFALSYDNQIIIEDFVEGQEYRFMVIDNKVIGVLKRVPANVIGDGTKTISDLVEEKNKNKLRGVGYKLPLEKIKIRQIEEDFLKGQEKDKDYIPQKDQIVYLRKNSNVSTGGDTYDVTDQMHERYKEIAIEATKGLGLKICGLDIIIPEIEEFKKYTILEMNWNPAIHIHTYPFVGKDRKVAEAILQLVDKYE